ncbi:hypothetical protein F0562_013965 [Nyssa sinensis]|uniref:SGNH hydrolase-type esterase domain-containing protein n=1 Tax=Nyssa sinensis TaxID=561372 RepID=A0A5J4ZLS4_9ASTE|nr:hypothetical protein F0562_013965 [Nyssa sinensis]
MNEVSADMLRIEVLVLYSGYGVEAAPQVPCYFIFGDSLVDNGNNNGLNSLAKANYMPYGIDFSAGPTGRFSNGKTTVDVIGVKTSSKAVNYASAAAGIRDETGQQLGARISMSGQVRNFNNTVSQVVGLLGNNQSAANYLSKCIYSVGMGSNDYLNNYFMPAYPTGRQYTPQQFAVVLSQQYSQQLRGLYNLGARKVAVIGVGQIGCSPNELAQNSPDGKTCVRRINDANQLFNDRLKSLVDDFNNNLPGAKFIYINAYGIFQEFIDNPSSYGLLLPMLGAVVLGGTMAKLHVFLCKIHAKIGSNIYFGMHFIQLKLQI